MSAGPVRRFRRRPQVVEMVEWDGSIARLADIIRWVSPEANPCLGRDGTLVVWNTEDSQHLLVPVGHWLVRGRHGEAYPISPDALRSTYEPADLGLRAALRRMLGHLGGAR